MGLFDFFKRSRGKKQIRSIIKNYYGGDWRYFVWNYANQIYDIPEVRIAIEKIADIFSSMPIYVKRVDKKTGFVDYLSDPTDRVLNYKPNALQNKTQFFKNAVTQLLVENNAFIEPVFDLSTGNLKMLFPLPSKAFKIELSENGQVGYVKFTDGKSDPNKRYNLEDIIYISRFCRLTGGEQNNLGLYETVIKSLGEQIVNYADPKKPRAILQSNQIGQGQLKPEDRKGAANAVKANFDESINGIVYFDKMWNITPISWNENPVNKDIMAFVIDTVYTYFGINDNIIKDKANEFEWAAFVNTTIKPMAMQFEQEFTNKLFTENEYYHGNRIEFDYQPLLITTMGTKVNLAQSGLRNGFLNIDEAREQFGYSPLKDGLGQKYRTSADLVNIEVVDEYELGKVGKTVSTAQNVSRETNGADDIKTKKEVSNESTD